MTVYRLCKAKYGYNMFFLYCINRVAIVISLHSLVLADRIKLYSKQPANFSLRTKTD